jgi:hypothetical protein
LSFHVPLDWNLSSCLERKGLWQIDMEDDYALRLNLEWMQLTAEVNAQTIQQRYAKAAGKLQTMAKSTEMLKDIPAAWTAFLYTMAEGHKLLTAYRLPKVGGQFAFFSLHFPADNTQKPQQILRIIIDKLREHDGDVIPWECYDLSFMLPRRFKLVETSFVAGRKSMVFQWRMRRFYIWQFSLADEVLKKKSLTEFAAEHLNTVKGLRGPQYTAEKGVVLARQRLIHPLGHMDQMKRLCRRYEIGCQHDAERNQIFLWLFHHRWKSDLEKLKGFQIPAPESSGL